MIRSRSFYCMIVFGLLTACAHDRDQSQARPATATAVAPKLQQAEKLNLAQKNSNGRTERSDRPQQAFALLGPKSNSDAAGYVQFLENQDDTVTIVARAKGLAPNTKHGFHIHEYGTCQGAGAQEAGGHLSPSEDSRHGAPENPQAHLGDLGNIQSDSAGEALYVQTFDKLSLTDRQGNILGRSIIIHSEADDLTSQPSGDSGNRIACGTIKVERTAEYLQEQAGRPAVAE